MRLPASITLLISLLLGAFPAAAKKYDLAAEIRRKKSELKRVLEQQQKIRKAIKRDAAEFKAYQARTRKRRSTLRGQLKTIQASTGKWRQKYAALGAVVERHNRTGRYFAYLQKLFRKLLIRHCTRLIAAARSLPPLASGKAISALTYLRSELIGRSVDNTEGIHRLVRIARRMDAQLMDIRVVQGSSPVPQITGTCYRLRLGGVFEAVVKGDSAAIWDFGRRTWRIVKDPKVARLLMRAVEVRTGKKVPALVRIPLSSGTSAKDSPRKGKAGASAGPGDKAGKAAKTIGRTVARKKVRSRRKARRKARRRPGRRGRSRRRARQGRKARRKRR